MPHATVARSEEPAGASPRITAVQRALADFGYGQIKGKRSCRTPIRKHAVEKFERERKLAGLPARSPTVSFASWPLPRAARWSDPR